MKKKKQTNRSLLMLVLIAVGIIVGLLALNISNFSLNSRAAGNCQGGIFVKGGDKKCYEIMAVACGSKCCNKVVDNKKCKDSKYNKEKVFMPSEEKYGLKCEGTNYYWSGIGAGKKCYLWNGKVCGSTNPYCCAKRVDNKRCE